MKENVLIDLNWNFILMTLAIRIDQLQSMIGIYDRYKFTTPKLDVMKEELSMCKKEYRKILIAQQKSNK